MTGFWEWLADPVPRSDDPKHAIKLTGAMLMDRLAQEEGYATWRDLEVARWDAFYHNPTNTKPRCRPVVAGLWRCQDAPTPFSIPRRPRQAFGATWQQAYAAWLNACQQEHNR